MKSNFDPYQVKYNIILIYLHTHMYKMLCFLYDTKPVRFRNQLMFVLLATGL